jgi:hypothetical protein
MAETLAQKAIRDGAAICLGDQLDRAIGTRVLTLHWERSYDKETQAALDILNEYGYVTNTTASVFVTDPKSQKDTHAGTWRLKTATYGKPKNADNGITAVYYLVNAVGAIADLVTLAGYAGRYAYGHDVLNLFGIETGEGEYAAISFYHLRPDTTTRTFCCDTLTSAAAIASLLSIWRDDHAQWSYADRKWDDRTEPGTATFTLLFRRVGWAKAWTDAREVQSQGKTDGRAHEVARTVRGVPVASLQTQYGAMTPATGNVIASKSYAETGDGAGALQSAEVKVNSITTGRAKVEWSPTYFDSEGNIRQAGSMTLHFLRVSDSDAVLIIAALDIQYANMADFKYYAFPTHYILRGVRDDDSEIGIHNISITCVDGRYAPGKTVEYGSFGWFIKRVPVYDDDGYIDRFRVYAWKRRVSAGSSTALTAAQGSADGFTAAAAGAAAGVDAGDVKHVVRLVDSDFDGAYGRWIGVVTYYCGTEDYTEVP